MAQPETPEAVMRARYAAYAAGDVDTVWRTWHPRTRPERAELARSMSQTTWTGLQVLGAGVDDATHGWVEFVASYRLDGTAGRLHERSRFEWRASQWLYVDGETDWSAPGR